MTGIGIFGGSFNPIHLGHINAALEVRDLLSLDKVLFVAAKLQPLKGELNDITHKERSEILALALKEQRAFELCDLELKRAGPSYTIDTLTELNKLYSAKQLYFIVGVDSFLQLASWKEPMTLLSLANFVLIARPTAPELNLELYYSIAQKWGYCYNGVKPIVESESQKCDSNITASEINTDNKRRNYENRSDNNTLSNIKGQTAPIHTSAGLAGAIYSGSVSSESISSLSTNSTKISEPSSPTDPSLRHRTPYMLTKLSNSFGLQLIGVCLTPHSISSSEIRQRISSGESISGLVPAVVEQRIKEAYTKT